MPRELLPDGTTADDVTAAVQAAWSANDYALARDLVDRYLSAAHCMRCGHLVSTQASSEAAAKALWRIGNDLGTFSVCPACAIEVQRRDEMRERGEMLSVGPPLRISQIPAPKRVEITAPPRGDAK